MSHTTLSMMRPAARLVLLVFLWHAIAPLYTAVNASASAGALPFAANDAGTNAGLIVICTPTGLQYIDPSNPDAPPLPANGKLPQCSLCLLGATGMGALPSLPVACADAHADQAHFSVDGASVAFSRTASQHRSRAPPTIL